MNTLPSDIQFTDSGMTQTIVPDWRTDTDPDKDPDDEQIATPADVIAVLGFDPADDTEPVTNELTPSQPVNPTPLAITSPPLPEEHSVLKAAADDLAPIRARLEAILAIDDEDLFKIKLVRFRDELPKLLHDMNADPDMSRAMETELVNAFFNGLTGMNKQGVTNAKA